MQCVEVVQAVTIARFGPLAPISIDSSPAIMLMMVPGMKNGEMRRGPFLLELVVLLLDQRQAADARAEVDADALGVLRRHLQRRQSRQACSAAAMP